jgi:nucleoside-diphosphate-sugar epimerase
MKVFVTGASGFIGSAVAAAFARAGHDVSGLHRAREKAASLAAREIEPVHGSMDDPRTYAEVARASSVLVHCAAEYSPRYMELDQKTIAALVDAARSPALPRTFVYTSGVWVYGDTGDGRADESTPLAPPAMVRPRAEHEQRVLAASTGLVRTIVIRPGCVYGASGSLTAAWFDTAKKRGAAQFVGDGRQRWAMVHLDDLAELYVRAAESACAGQVFNATDRSRFSVQDCARAASRAAGAGGKVESISVAEASKTMGPMAECLALDQHVDSSKAARLLGWQPRHGGFVDGVERYFRAWQGTVGG